MSNKIADTFNEYGTPVTMFRCGGCGEPFTVCPAVADEDLRHWDGCLAESCSSYDPERDADRLFDEGRVYRVGDRSGFAVIVGGSSDPAETAPSGPQGTDGESA